jgi:hypothetical protein
MSAQEFPKANANASGMPNMAKAAFLRIGPPLLSKGKRLSFGDAFIAFWLTDIPWS